MLSDKASMFVPEHFRVLSNHFIKNDLLCVYDTKENVTHFHFTQITELMIYFAPEYFCICQAA